MTRSKALRISTTTAPLPLLLRWRVEPEIDEDDGKGDGDAGKIGSACCCCNCGGSLVGGGGGGATEGGDGVAVTSVEAMASHCSAKARKLLTSLLADVLLVAEGIGDERLVGSTTSVMKAVFTSNRSDEERRSRGVLRSIRLPASVVATAFNR